jgi:hypothetical protein
VIVVVHVDREGGHSVNAEELLGAEEPRVVIVDGEFAAIRGEQFLVVLVACRKKEGAVKERINIIKREGR